ncbi:Conserved hypothetical protein [Allorhizobium ampelinum S4]|uniref:Uncharacterized protein n=1 Tax=Allorhizobium ampelinum (strain ATCC BAA-846 / DSM 112012 / S4) TaxID=311402 RepID=B9JYV6_ALLAM|nr:Conserved hypothetical protein [Allorhizobium ampelinum S4]
MIRCQLKTGLLEFAQALADRVDQIRRTWSAIHERPPKSGRMILASASLARPANCSLASSSTICRPALPASVSR